jgi:hypothetical protein
VIISLWVDGNFKAWKRKRAGKRRKKVSRKVTKTGLCYRLLLLKKNLSKPVSCSGIPGLHAALRHVAGVCIAQEVTGWQLSA